MDRSAGRRTRLLTYGPGGFFGEMALLDGNPRSADAVADSACVVLALSRDAMDRLENEDPALYARLLFGLALHLADRLRSTTALLDEISH